MVIPRVCSALQATAAFGAMLVMPAVAATITFDDLVPSGSLMQSSASGLFVQVDGFDVRYAAVPGGTVTIGTPTGSGAAGDGTPLLSVDGGGSVSLSKADGSVFSLLSFDAGNLLGNETLALEVVGELAAGGTVSASDQAQGRPTLSTMVSPGFDGLASVTFMGDGSAAPLDSFVLDNLVVADAPAPVSMPEPASLSLFGAAAFGAALLSRRHRHRVTP